MGTLQRESDGREVLLSTEHVVGRMPSCGLCLSDSFISLAHALIRWNGQHWELRDLGSTNGTFANGRRLAPGESAILGRGSTLAFGDCADPWRLTTDTAPVPAAIPVDGGEPRFFVSGAIAIPDPESPSAVIVLDDDNWVLEVSDSRKALAFGEQFLVDGREWRFECPAIAAITYASEERLYSLDDSALVFEASRDEEHVTLTLRVGARVKHFRERTCFYLALVLARRRANDEREGSTEPGWIDIETLLQMVPDYSCHSALNVEIFRLRRFLYEAGVGDAARIVERRRGQVRFGSARVELRSILDSSSEVVERV
jgi:hypothetical protein